MQIVRFPLAALAAAAVAMPLQAQPTDPYGNAPATTYDAPRAINTGQFEISAGAEVVSTYIFRGAEQQDSGLIIQPWAEIGTALGDSGFDLTLGTWSSLHSRGDAVGTNSGANSPSTVFETDLYVGVSYELDQWTLSGQFQGFYSPAGNFGSVEELNFTAQFDDSAFLEEWAVSPYVFIAFEIRDENSSEDIYLELGGELTAPFIDSESLPVELTFPFALGFSIDDFYTDAGGGNEAFGFLKLGAQVSMDLDMIPEDYGSWVGHAGIDLWFVNDDAGLLDSGDEFEPVLRAGVSLSY